LTSDRLQHLLRVFARVDLADCLRYPAVDSDDVGHSLSVLGLRIIAGAVCKADLSIGIAKQLERKVELLRERFVLVLSVEADAQYLGILVCVVSDSITEPDAFGRSAGGVGFRIEPENYVPASQVAQPHLLTGMRFDRKVRRFVANLQHKRRFSSLTFYQSFHADSTQPHDR
jgi:hypothetical protein